MKRTFKIAVLVLLVVSILMSSIACTTNQNPEPATTAGGTTAAQEQSFKVTFDLQNGTDPIIVYVKEGETVQLPEIGEDPYREFRGWYESSLGIGRAWDAKKPITAETVLYACWNSIFAKVNFDLNYKGAPKINSLTMNLGELVKQPQIPERACWEFVGWFTDKELTVPFDLNEPLAKKSLNLYGAWKLEDGHVHAYTGVVTAPTCTADGYTTNTCLCGDTVVDSIVAMIGHSFDFTGLDYIQMASCANEGCNQAARKESLRIYEDDFVYNFSEAKKAEIDGRYAQMCTLLAEIARYNATLHGYVKDSERYIANKKFEDIYNAYYDDLNYVIEQYQYAYVFYCVNGNDENTAAYEFISECRTQMISDFYTLYRLIHATEYREYFFAEDEGWTPEDIKQALLLSDSYGSEEYKKINDRLNEIEIDFRDISDPETSADVPKLYEEFVKLNNEMAKLAGYDNYVDYAYENVYSREYTPEQTAVMRAFVKQNLRSVFSTLYIAYVEAVTNPPASGTDAHDLYKAIMNSSLFNSLEGSELVRAYLQEMTSTTAGEKAIDFYLHANDLFKNGNYYTGSYQGAFSYWIDAQDTSILYFGPGSYSGAFTFIHEFGHYYQNVYNGGIGVSYDLEEVYSQANEILFLAYLEDLLPADIRKEMYDNVYYENLLNLVATIMLATAVDEFEYCVYTGTSPAGVPTVYTAKDYDRLFSDIMASYGIKGKLNESYWRYVVIEAPCYYISYAMSAIPCLELLTVADSEGFEAAKNIYLKFFTFTDDQANVEVDEMGDKIVKIGYIDTLKYVGLHSVFDAETYTRIAAYFNKEKDFSYEKAA